MLTLKAKTPHVQKHTAKSELTPVAYNPVQYNKKAATTVKTSRLTGYVSELFFLSQ